MDIQTALTNRRTIRRFAQTPIETQAFEHMLNAARLAPCGANRQALAYTVVTRKDTLDDLFALTRWAGYLPGYAPSPEHRPTAFVAVVCDTKQAVTAQADAGAAIQSLMLSAFGDGIGACWIGSFDSKKAAALLDIDPSRDVLYLVALGYPAQEAKEAPYTDSVKYYEDESALFCVPKRPLEAVVRFIQ